MSKPDVLDRVSADLALGHTQPAIQRLSSLVAAHPTDLDLRRRLARLYRMVGNRIEAGRWDYLTPGASTGEVAAFERAFPSPSRRLAALRWPWPVDKCGATGAPSRSTPAWPDHPGGTATGYARARLEALAQAATAESARLATRARLATGPRLASGARIVTGWRPHPGACSPRLAAVALAGLGAAFFAVLGALTVVQWLLR